MRRRLRATCAVLAWLSAAASAADAPGTLRVDYFHTGGRGAEIFALDRISIEPLPWPGHPARTIDSGEPGVYRNEVPFCRVCQRALGQVIDLYAGPRRLD